MVHKEDGADWGLGSWLMSDATYGDFELLVDARPDWPCDTGIYVRTASGTRSRAFRSCSIIAEMIRAAWAGTSGFSTCAGSAGCGSTRMQYRWTVGGDGSPTDVKLVPDKDGFREDGICRDQRGLSTGLAPERLEYLPHPCGGSAAKDHRLDQRGEDLRMPAMPRRSSTRISMRRMCKSCSALAGTSLLKSTTGRHGAGGVGKVSRWRNIQIKEATVRSRNRRSATTVYCLETRGLRKPRLPAGIAPRCGTAKRAG